MLYIFCLCLSILVTSIMKFIMFTQSYNHQILNSIIQRIAINMVDFFLLFKKSSEAFLHYESMFSYFIAGIFEWMIIRFTKSDFSNYSTIVFSHFFRMPNMFAFLRAKTTSIVFKAKLFNFKGFTAIFTNLCSILHRFSINPNTNPVNIC